MKLFTFTVLATFRTFISIIEVGITHSWVSETTYFTILISEMKNYCSIFTDRLETEERFGTLARVVICDGHLNVVMGM